MSESGDARQGRSDKGGDAYRNFKACELPFSLMKGDEKLLAVSLHRFQLFSFWN
jgi:hypothetical protein